MSHNRGYIYLDADNRRLWIEVLGDIWPLSDLVPYWAIQWVRQDDAYFGEDERKGVLRLRAMLTQHRVDDLETVYAVGGWDALVALADQPAPCTGK